MNPLSSLPQLEKFLHSLTLCFYSILLGHDDWNIGENIFPLAQIFLVLQIVLFDCQKMLKREDNVP